MEAQLFTNLPAVEPEQIRRLRRDEYDRLVESGVFGNEHVELIRGVIIRMTPQGPPHAGPIEVLTELLVPALVGRARVRIRLPLIAPDESEPEPDIAVVPVGNPSIEHPREAHFVIEVARTSQAYDLGTKGPLYAQMGVAEYWVVDVVARVVDVHRLPSADSYASVTHVRAGDSIRLEAFPDVSIAVNALFG